MLPVLRPADTFDHRRGRKPLLRPTSLGRRIVFVAVNLVGFATVAAFWQFLVTGKWLALAAAAYRRSLTMPFEILLYPLSVLTHRWMILVVGLLLGVMIFVPIIVAVMYRVRVSLLFLIVLAAVAPMPLLTVSVGVGCLLATSTRLRSNLPMLASILGLLPVAALLGLLDMLGLLPIDPATPPLWRWLMYMPFLLAGVAAILSFATVLTLAHVSKFRPGIIWPVLLVLLAAPLVVFYGRVGADELHYALIVRPDPENRLAPGDAVFGDLPLAQFAQRPGLRGLTKALLQRRAEDDLHRRRDRLLGQCDRFLRRYPRSRRTPSVMWIVGQCHCLRLDLATFDHGAIRCTAVFADPAAQPTWQALIERYDHSPQAGLAQLRLAELALRDPAQMSRARSLLARARSLLQGHDAIGADGRATPPARLFPADPSLPSDSYYAAALEHAHRLIWLMGTNDLLAESDEAHAMAEWMQVNPTERGARTDYLDLADRFGHTQLKNNLQLAAALTVTDPYERARELRPLAEAPSTDDAAVQANYELGRLVTQERALRLQEGIRPAAVYFRRVIEAAPNPWRRQAEEALAWLPTQEVQPK